MTTGVRPTTVTEALRERVIPNYGPGDPCDPPAEWRTMVRVFAEDATDEEIDEALRAAVDDGLLTWDGTVYARWFDDEPAEECDASADQPGPIRPETGPIVFGDDWRAYLIRGDDAFNIHAILSRLLDAVEAGKQPDKVSVIIARNFTNALREVDERTRADDMQRCRTWTECVVSNGERHG